MNTQAEAVRTLMDGRAARAHRALPNVIVIAAGKGGVGTSTVAALLAAAAAKSGRSTLLVDASASGPAALRSILAVAQDDDADMTHELAPHLSFVGTPTNLAGTSDRRARARRLTSGYAERELVVIDAGSTVDAISAVLAAGAGRLIAVTSADRLGVVSTYALLKYLAERFPTLPAGVLVNRAEPDNAAAAFGRITEGVETFLRRSAVLVGSMPYDDEVLAASEAGVSPVPLNSNAAHAAALITDVLLLAGSGINGRLRLLKTT